MSETEAPPAKPRRIRWRRILGTLLFLALAGAGVYGASWFNARRYFLVVDATEVKIRKGRMLPVGHEAFVPADPALRKAYQPFPLPGGMKLPRGESVFDDRVELDQAIFRILEDALEFSLAADNARTPELTAKYLQQIRALPGLNAQQQVRIAKLARDAIYVEARGFSDEAERLLDKAEQGFAESAKGHGGGQHKDGAVRAGRIRAALRVLREGAPAPESEVEVPVSTPPPALPGTSTTTSTDSAP